MLTRRWLAWALTCVLLSSLNSRGLEPVQGRLVPGIINVEDVGPLPPLPDMPKAGPAGERLYPANISGTYKGTWDVTKYNSTLQNIPFLQKQKGNIIFQVASSPTQLEDIHYVHGEIVLRDGLYITDEDVHMVLEGVYVWRFGQLRVVLNSDLTAEMRDGQLTDLDGEHKHAIGEAAREHRQVQQPSRGSNARRMQNCRFRMFMQLDQETVQVDNSGTSSAAPIQMAGKLESANCFTELSVNATAVALEVYYNKAINYTLMVTFVSFLQVLFLIRQMEYSNTQTGAAKVSLLTIGHQAILDAYLCLLHLTAGIVVESLFNAFATAAFFKFVIFSIFEMRYLLAIWKARRPSNFEGWGSMRRELSILYSRFYGCLLAGIIFMYQLQGLLRYVIFLFYAFWIPQILSNVERDSRKALHPQYIIGVSVTRLAIPLYMYGCPQNFMRVEPNPTVCLLLVGFVALQAGVLLLQHYFGARCFIPARFLPLKYDYYRVLKSISSLEEGSAGEVDCVICMLPIDVTQRKPHLMTTPCDHMFHANCLQKWMDIKMECPVCRRPLPPL
mmetsp:Transcript_5222/g.19155  ORF Transcript_5222/g.19155 Transcript_5222/m.19155 type:complete len:558 (-) Transcript_5222:137-1810(-)